MIEVKGKSLADAFFGNTLGDGWEQGSTPTITITRTKPILVLPKTEIDEGEILNDLSQEDLSTLGWRREVVQNGLYWNWRKGRGEDRKTLYGGRFSTLSKERQAEYYVNKVKKAKKAKGNRPRRSSSDA